MSKTLQERAINKLNSMTSDELVESMRKHGFKFEGDEMTRKLATVRDLHKLCTSLIEDGFIEAELSFNDEYGIDLGDFGYIDYEVFKSVNGKTYIDIQP